MYKRVLNDQYIYLTTLGRRPLARLATYNDVGKFTIKIKNKIYHSMYISLKQCILEGLNSRTNLLTTWRYLRSATYAIIGNVQTSIK